MRKILFAACCALTACGPAASTPSRGPVEVPTQVVNTGDAIHVTTSAEVRVVSNTVDAPVDRVWAVLPAVYQELGLETSADADRRTAMGGATVIRRFQGESATRFFDCGVGQFGSQIAANYTIRMTVSTTVNPGSDGGDSRLDTMIEAFARSNDGANAVAAQCRTQGRLEQLISDRVRAKLAS
ncbi:hypothetical protein [Longimicrobium sp.]|uniref:hypothetical protein n=1 Tax=Longimicrobium sp. TaxID=2029185 RepID=UPI002E318379|nr:hypothetical protein [Longimicrobium sp.]HEX6041311.1 hypothetical protein [Longimicrobium sp.]